MSTGHWTNWTTSQLHKALVSAIDRFKGFCADHSECTFDNYGPQLERLLMDFAILEQDYVSSLFAGLFIKGEYVVKLTHDDDGVEKMWVIVDGITVAEFKRSTNLHKNDIVYVPDLDGASSNKFWQVTSTTPTMADGVVNTLATLRSIQDESVLELFEESTKFFTLVTPGPVKECLFCGHILSSETSLCVDNEHARCVLERCRQDCFGLPHDHGDDMNHP